MLQHVVAALLLSPFAYPLRSSLDAPWHIEHGSSAAAVLLGTNLQQPGWDGGGRTSVPHKGGQLPTVWQRLILYFFIGNSKFS